MLSGRPILIAEDQIFIALDLAQAIKDAGGEVVGPAASVAEALALLATTDVAAAILDVELVGADCSAVVEVLVTRRIPMIIQTGARLPPRLAARFPDLTVYAKPCASAKLVEQLEAMIDSEPSRHNTP